MKQVKSNNAEQHTNVDEELINALNKQMVVDKVENKSKVLGKLFAVLLLFLFCMIIFPFVLKMISMQLKLKSMDQRLPMEYQKK